MDARVETADEDLATVAASALRRGVDVLAAGVVLGAATAALAAGDASAGHVDPFAPILLELALVMLLAMLGRFAAERLGQPPVLGELLAGVLVGNAGVWLGGPIFILIMHLGNVQEILARLPAAGQPLREVAAQLYAPAELAPGTVGGQVLELLSGPRAASLVLLATALWIFSNLGVILLLFLVGVESTIEEMLDVGPRALAVAIVGVVAPFALGFAATEVLLPGASPTVALFLGATLCATSVGITARVLKDMGRMQSAEAKVILGAAVIDDVLGLVVLAIVVGVALNGSVQLSAVARIGGQSIVFLGALLLFGERLVALLVPVTAALDRAHLRLLFPLVLAFGLSWLASTIELATIVGAFAAGLILTEKAFARQGGKGTVEDAVRPLEVVFAPAFFVVMGMQVNLATFAVPSTIGVALGLSVAAVAGKLVSGVAAGRRADRLTIGMGMVPRGEVGLIFASIGKGIGIVDEGLFSAVVAMVLLTTLVAPILLKWSIARAR